MTGDCTVDELMNAGGEYRCETDSECRGDRICDASGWCTGRSNCPAFDSTSEEDDMLSGIEESSEK